MKFEREPLAVQNEVLDRTHPLIFFAISPLCSTKNQIRELISISVCEIIKKKLKGKYGEETSRKMIEKSFKTGSEI